MGGRGAVVGTAAGAAEPAHLDIVVPAHDEARWLVGTVERLVEVTVGHPFTTRITIVDSGSRDATWPLAVELSRRFERVTAVRVDRPGRGLALRTAWMQSASPLLGYIDADLSADPAVLLRMVEAVERGGADIAIGSRLDRASSVDRRLLREVLSHAYSELLQVVAAPPFRDAQCGVKLFRADRCLPLLARVVDDHWFFDTELLLHAWTDGLRIVELPVEWVERRESRVRLLPTILGDLAGLARMTADRARGRYARSTPGPQHDAVLVERAAREAIACAVAVAATSGSRRGRRASLGGTCTVVGIALWDHRRPRPGSTPWVDATAALVFALAAGLGGATCRSVPVRAARARTLAATFRLAVLSVWRRRC